MNENIFEVVGIDDSEGVTFAICTTREKAQKVKELLEVLGFEYQLIIQNNPIDRIIILEVKLLNCKQMIPTKGDG